MRNHNHKDCAERAEFDWINNSPASDGEADNQFIIAERREAMLAEIDCILDERKRREAVLIQLVATVCRIFNQLQKFESGKEEA